MLALSQRIEDGVRQKRGKRRMKLDEGNDECSEMNANDSMFGDEEIQLHVIGNSNIQFISLMIWEEENENRQIFGD